MRIRPQIARLNEPLPGGLRARLLAIPTASAGQRVPVVPVVPLPEALRERLLGLGTLAGREIPFTIRNPRYVVVASYLLAMLTFLTIGDPVAWSSEVATVVQTEVGVIGRRLEVGARSLYGRAEEETRSRLIEVRATVDGSIAAVRSTVDHTLNNVGRLLPVDTNTDDSTDEETDHD